MDAQLDVWEKQEVTEADPNIVLAYAVKVLNPEIMSPGDALQNFRVAERVARAVSEGGRARGHGEDGG